MKDACFFNAFQHALCFSAITSKWFCADNSFFVLATKHYRFFMQVVWKRDTDYFYFWPRNGFFHIYCPMSNIIILGKFLSAFFTAGIDTHYLILASITL